MSRALCQLALDRNADAFEEIRPPSLVTTATLTATGQLPKFADDAYAIERDDLWCIPTAEVPLTSIGRDEIFAEADLPMRFMAYTPCYRREAGSAGRDTRGLLRSHEFDKVEILAYTTPAQAPGMLDELLARGVAMIEALGLAYRILDIATGDLGQSHHRSFDIEVYAPGCDQWLEVSSVSWFSDYQARRANIRYRPAAGEGHRAAAHAQRLGAGGAARAGRHLGDVPPARRVGGHPRGAVAVHARRPRDPRPRLLSRRRRVGRRAPNRAESARFGDSERARRRRYLREAVGAEPLLGHVGLGLLVDLDLHHQLAPRPSVLSLALTASSTAVTSGRGLGLVDERQHGLVGDDVLVVGRAP